MHPAGLPRFHARFPEVHVDIHVVNRLTDSEANPRVRLFIDFVAGLFRELEAEREGGIASRAVADRPQWHRRHYGRASAALRGRE